MSARSGRHPRWPDRIVLLLLLVPATAIVAAGLYALAARFVIHGPVRDHSLHRSVSLAAGSAALLGSDPSDRCVPHGPRRWHCDVWDSGGSGTVRYAVRVQPDGSCWDARLDSSPGEPMPETVSGCVHRWQWAIFR
jgi:hypothetical protein